MKKWCLLFLATLFMTLLIPNVSYAYNWNYTNTWDKPPELIRYSGSDRYATNIQVSQDHWSSNSKNCVVLVNGESYADGIIAVPLAHSQDNQDASHYGTSVLLHPYSTSLTSSVYNEISRLLMNPGPKKVYVVGGLSDALVSEMQTYGWSAEKIAGSDRYETAYNVATKVYQTKSNPNGNTAILVHGESFADAIGSLGYAGNNNYPMLLTQTGSLSYWAERAITENNVKTVKIVGGTGVISSNVETTLRNIGVTNVIRYSGADRYETNYWFNQAFENFDFEKRRKMVVTTGEDFPNAITSGFLAAMAGRPIVLSSNPTLPSIQSNYINDQSKRMEQLQWIFIVGGAVSSNAESEVKSAGWWWAPWSTLYVEDDNPTYLLRITGFMNFYQSIPEHYGTSDVDFERNFYMPTNQNLKFDYYETNFPYWAYNFHDFGHTENEHDWVGGTTSPEDLSSEITYYLRFFADRNNISQPIPYASNLKIYDESQLKIYGNVGDNSALLTDLRPSFRFNYKRNL